MRNSLRPPVCTVAFRPGTLSRIALTLAGSARSCVLTFGLGFSLFAMAYNRTTRLFGTFDENFWPACARATAPSIHALSSPVRFAVAALSHVLAHGSAPRAWRAGIDSEDCDYTKRLSLASPASRCVETRVDLSSGVEHFRSAASRRAPDESMLRRQIEAQGSARRFFNNLDLLTAKWGSSACAVPATRCPYAPGRRDRCNYSWSIDWRRRKARGGPTACFACRRPSLPHVTITHRQQRVAAAAVAEPPGASGGAAPADCAAVANLSVPGRRHPRRAPRRTFPSVRG
jgi:hypothetical protein